MDEEPSTDLTSSSGQNGLKQEDVVSSWQFVEDSAVSSTCSSRPNSSSLAQTVSGRSSSKSGVICHKIYRRPTSTLQPCFSMVSSYKTLHVYLVDHCSINQRRRPCLTEGVSSITRPHPPLHFLPYYRKKNQNF